MPVRRLGAISGFQGPHHRPFKTRILAMLNIVGAGMRGGRYEAEHVRHGREALPRWLSHPGSLWIKSAHSTVRMDPNEQASSRAPKQYPVMVDKRRADGSGHRRPDAAGDI